MRNPLRSSHADSRAESSRICHASRHYLWFSVLARRAATCVARRAGVGREHATVLRCIIQCPAAARRIHFDQLFRVSTHFVSLARSFIHSLFAVRRQRRLPMCSGTFRAEMPLFCRVLFYVAVWLTIVLRSADKDALTLHSIRGVQGISKGISIDLFSLLLLELFEWSLTK